MFVSRSAQNQLVQLCLVAAFAQGAWPQAPQITSAGVVNAASYAQPVSPGSLVSIFGTNLASAETAATGTPLPTELGGTSVTVNGVRAPLLFVSPRQINLEAPSSLSIKDNHYTRAMILVSTPSGSSATAEVPVYQTGPGIFASDPSGCGQAAALNVAANGRTSPNSPSNSAAPGDYITIFGTGNGSVINPPPDGTFVTGPSDLFLAVGVLLNNIFLANYSYSGLAPKLVGVDQVNFQIPPDAQQGCSVPLAIQADALTSPTVTISVHAGRGQCVDPPVQSFGQVSLIKTVATGTANDGETEILTATFPSGPALQRPEIQILPTGSYVGNNLSPVPVSRACPVPGYLQLSAGSIQVQATARAAAITAQPIAQVGGVTYRQELPAGFIAAGEYAISASGGPVTFEGQWSPDPPIQILTLLPAGTTISSGQPFTVNWTGGLPGTLVKVSLISGEGISNPFLYGYANAEAGTLTFDPIYNGSVQNPFCTFTLPLSNAAQVVVEVSPAPGNAVIFPAQGLTGTVEASWTYRWVFGGLVLGG